MHCISNVNFYCRHIKIGKCCPHLQNLYSIYPFFVCKCVLYLPLFVQCKLKLQVQSKHIKILGKKKKKKARTKLAYLKEKRKKKKREKKGSSPID